MAKEDDIEKGSPLRWVTKFLTKPHGIDDKSKGLVDTQGDWTSVEMARMQIYHRAIAMRIKSDVPNQFADLVSMMTWGKDRKSRTEAVVAITRLMAEKAPMRMEKLEEIDYKPPEGEKK